MFGRGGQRTDPVLGNDPGIDHGAGGPVELGETYTDVITGFVGVATARFVYLYGCVRVLLEGGDAADPKEIIVDEQRLTTGAGIPVTITATTGGARPKPARHTRG